MKTQSKQKWKDKTINGKKTLFFNEKLILLVSCHDIIMKLSEFSELSEDQNLLEGFGEDYIAEMLVKLGLVQA